MSAICTGKHQWLSGETESSGSMSSDLAKNYDDQQEAQKGSPNHDVQSPEVTSRAGSNDQEVNLRVKNLTEKLSAALVNVSAKDDLVKQHAKVAEEAVAGWEKAENDAALLNQQLEASIQKNLELEDRVSHLDGALKECVRQLRQSRDEQEQQLHEATVKKSQEWEAAKFQLENRLLELQIQIESSKSESVDLEINHRIDFLEGENDFLRREISALKLELFTRSEELEIKTIERDLSIEAAETASKQHLEGIKKVAKLEAECRKLKAVARKSPSLQDQKSVNASSLYVESLTDSQSDSGERLTAVDNVNEFDSNCSDSWASALIAKLDQCKTEKSERNLVTSAVELELMGDFLEMERLAALPSSETKNHSPESSEPILDQSVIEETPLKLELESMHHYCNELKEKLMKVEAEKEELEKKLEATSEMKAQMKMKLNQMETERNELEIALRIQLKEAEMKLFEVRKELQLTNEKKRDFESQLVSVEVETKIMCAKIDLLEAEIEKERVLSEEMSMKCRELEDKLSTKTLEAELQKTSSSNGELKIKQENLVMAAGKLAECQQTIASLGKQLKSLATLEDFLIDTTNIIEFSEGGHLLSTASGGAWRLHSNNTFSAQRNQDSLNLNDDNPASSFHIHDGSTANHMNLEKGQNGFVKMFSSSKGGIQLEDH